MIILLAHARSHPEGGGDGGQYGDYDVQDFAPEVFFHFWFLIYDLWFLFYTTEYTEYHGVFIEL